MSYLFLNFILFTLCRPLSRLSFVLTFVWQYFSSSRAIAWIVFFITLTFHLGLVRLFHVEEKAKWFVKIAFPGYFPYIHGSRTVLAKLATAGFVNLANSALFIVHFCSFSENNFLVSEDGCRFELLLPWSIAKLYPQPFVLGVVTDSDEGGALTANNAPEDKANRGFKLIYNQQPCMAG